MVHSPLECETTVSTVEEFPVSIHIQFCYSGLVEAFEHDSFVFWHDVRDVDCWNLWLGQNSLLKSVKDSSKRQDHERHTYERHGYEVNQ